MINYFPVIYPDELVYSWFSRYAAKVGYTSYIFVAEDLYAKRNNKPNIEFLNELSKEVINVISKKISIESLVMRHTMFPFYARFLPQERKQKAFDVLVSEQRTYASLLPIPKTKDGTTRFLRYCPLCAKVDRESQGETYWHRIHQMVGVNVCSIHGCRLLNSDVEISSKGSPALITAEESISWSEKSITYGSDLEFKVAAYMEKILEADMDLHGNVAVGDFFHSTLANTKYVSPRGKQRNISLLHKDFTAYYEELPGNWFKELWQLQKVFNGYRWNMYEVCLLAVFLQIPENELVNMRLPEQTQEELFDARVRELHKKGLNYRQIASALNAPYDVVKPIGEGNYGKYHYYLSDPKKGGAKKRDWAKIDNERLPHVKEAINQLQGNKEIRPKKITIGAVASYLHLSKKGFENCPKCRAEIQRYHESQDEYWCREIIWAANKVLGDSKELNWNNIRRIINIKRTDFERCKSLLNDDGVSDVVLLIKAL